MKLAVVITLLCAIGALAADVQVSEQILTLPTYAEDPPDPTPAFDGNYPYPLRNGITQQRNEEAWRAIVLENEYLRCRILPDLGGRLYGCTDKRNGREMFFSNPSIRKASVGLRGAWVAAGVEPNFPVGHSRVTVSPVDFAFRRNSDGSASVVTGSTDQVSGMMWQTEFVLRPGESAVEERVLLYNPTATPRRYYWWNNAEILFSDPNTRFILPTHLVATYGQTQIDTWPVSQKGVDLSVVSHYASDAATFAYRSNEPFEGVYEPGSRTATVHVADGDAVPGKKTYVWGKQRDDWVRHNLTDDGSTYVEFQAGLFQDQDTFQMLGPQQSRAFTEYWIPVKDLGGISRASRAGVLHLDTQNGALQAELEATRPLRRARISITQNGRTLLDEASDLDPADKWARAVPAYTAGSKCRFDLRDAGGQVVLTAALSSDGNIEYDALTPDRVRLGEQPAADLTDHGTEEGFLRRAAYNESHANLVIAFSDYDRGLKKFPDSVALHLAKGRLAVTLLRFADAVRELTWVRDKAPDNNQARYYLGVALAREGNDSAAEPELRAALHEDSLRSAAAIELGGLLARRGDQAEAARQFHSVIEQNPNALRAAVLEIATLRRQRRLDAAREQVRGSLARAPEDNMLRFEAVLLGGSEEGLWQHLGGNTERVLDIAADYFFLGAWSDALALLSRDYPSSTPNETEPGSVLPQENPLVAYYRAYCRMRLAQSPAADLKTARSLPARYVFPHRASDFTVLQAALGTQEEDGTAHLLLGYLYRFSLDQPRAFEQWHRARMLRPDLPALAAVLAKTDLPRVATVSAAALQPTPGEVPPQPLHRANIFAPPQPAAVSAMPAPTIAPPASGADPHQIAASALMRSVSNLDEALGAFNERNFPDEKQDEFVRWVWIELRLQRIRAMAPSGDCDAILGGIEMLGDEVDAVPFTIRGFGSILKEPRMQFYEASLENACGRQKTARKRLEHLAKDDAGAFSILAAMRLKDPDAASAAEAAVKTPATTAMQLFDRGMLCAALGRKAEARTAFQQGAKAPGDEAAHYLNLRGLTELQ